MDRVDRVKVRGEIELSELGEDDYAAISALIRGMDNTGSTQLNIRDKSPDYYRWMYQDNPAGRAVVYGARHGGQLVASFAIAPKLMQVGGEVMLVGKTMDMFTSPDYQGLGLMSLCAQAAFDHAADRGIGLYYVTPSPNSYPIFLSKFHCREEFKVQYRARMLDLGQLMRQLIRPVALGTTFAVLADRARQLAGGLKHRALPDGYSVEESLAFGEAEETLWNQVSSSYSVATVRNASYLNWRYRDNPDTYRVFKLSSNRVLVGLVVVKRTVRRGLPVGEIVDYVCGRNDDRTFGLLVQCAVQGLRDEGVAIAEAWTIPGTRQQKRFRAAGLWFPRAVNKFLLSPSALPPQFYVKHAWLLTLGDGNDV